MSYEVLAIIIGVVGSILGGLNSWFIFNRFWKKKSYVPSNASELLTASHPEEWNEVRILNSNWIPDLSDGVLEGKTLPSANFNRAVLVKVSFRNALLDGAEFAEANLKGADFTNASLNGASFDRADLSGAKFSGAAVEGASFYEARTDDNTVGLELGAVSKTVGRKGEELLSRVADDLDWLYRITPRQFEEILATAFRRMNYQVELTKADADQGYDLLLTRQDPLTGPMRVVVEAKRTKRDLKVGESSLRSLYAAKVKTGADRALLVTTNAITHAAKKALVDLPGLIVVDRRALGDWLRHVAG
jgi:hypothetical protein